MQEKLEKYIAPTTNLKFFIMLCFKKMKISFILGMSKTIKLSSKFVIWLVMIFAYDFYFILRLI